jgi:hypothetical protein
MPTLVTESQRLRAMNVAADAPTEYTDRTLAITPPSSGRIPASDRRIDSVANMSLASNPGAYDLFPGLRRKKWLVPFALASTLALVGMTVIALYFAFRTSGPTQVVSANPAPTTAPTTVPTTAPTLSPADSAVVVLDELPATPPEAKPEKTETGATTAAPHAPPAPAAMAAKSYQPASTLPASGTKKPATRKDIYRPF